MTLQLTCPSFKPGDDIPVEFTCDGADVSPMLTWNDPPQGTQSFALVMDDPDSLAGTWVHWLLYDLASTKREAPQGIRSQGTLPSGARQGRNDFHRTGYGGPCPPPGLPHRYFFRLYALDTTVNLPPGATRDTLDRAMRDHVLATAELFGRYQRRSHRD
jgi:Raf kinase inhibitor-like YbhB/YbcL family protein